MKLFLLRTLSPKRTFRKERSNWSISYSSARFMSSRRADSKADAPLQRCLSHVSMHPRIWRSRNLKEPHWEFMSSMIHVRITTLSFVSKFIRIWWNININLILSQSMKIKWDRKQKSFQIMNYTNHLFRQLLGKS